MAYDKTKYTAFRSLGVPVKIALALADESAPVNAIGAAVDDTTDVTDVAVQLNALLAELRTLGLIAESQGEL